MSGVDVAAAVRVVETAITDGNASGDLTAAAEALLALRRQIDPDGPHSAARAAVTLLLARVYFDKGELVAAETWALRALQDGPKAAIFMLLGEIAWAKLDVESARGWFTAAGAGGQVDPDYFALPPAFTVDAPTDNHVLVLMTAPRTPSTLERTLGSLQAAGLERWRGGRLLVADGYIPNTAPGFTSFLQVNSRGQLGAMCAGLRAALMMGAQRITLCEDDIALCPNTLDYIDRVVLSHGVRLIAWHYGGIHPYKSSRTPVLAVFPLSKFSRLQCVTFTRDAVAEFLAVVTVPEGPHPHRRPRAHGGDIMLARTVPGQYAVHFPNLVQHTGGMISTVGNLPEARLSDTFAGEDFDALSLIF